MPEGLSVHRRGETAELIIDRPRKRNAITYEMWEALPSILEEVERDDAARVLIIRGSGEHFSAGADISEFEHRRGDPDSARAYNELVARAERTLVELRKPTIAMIRGYCLGGGCELAVACDLRFAAHTAQLGITPAKLGLVYGFAATRHLVQLVGLSYAKYLLFSGVRVGADEASRSGLVDQVFADDEIDSCTAEYADTVCERSQVSVRGAKTMIGKVADGLTTEDDETRKLPVEAIDSADYREGVRAFLEKRSPRFVVQ